MKCIINRMLILHISKMHIHIFASQCIVPRYIITPLLSGRIWGRIWLAIVGCWWSINLRQSFVCLKINLIKFNWCNMLTSQGLPGPAGPPGEPGKPGDEVSGVLFMTFFPCLFQQKLNICLDIYIFELSFLFF